MTDVERKVWWKLRELNARGYQFRRQVPFQSYVLDFAEHRARLVIELDGTQHAESLQRARDVRRDALISDQGYRTLRFWNTEVTENIDGVVERIVSMLPEVEHRPPPAGRNASRSARATSPQRGR